MPSSVKGLSLLVQTPDGESISYEIRKLVTRIGRAPTNDLVLIEPSISRKHAALIIDRAQQRLFIEDLRSQNGTRVNGEIINDMAPVQIGDIITLGEEITIQLQEYRLQAQPPEDRSAIYNFPDSE